MGSRTNTRDRMVQAARIGFRTHGYTATGFSEIIGEAGAARGAIYHHFPGGKQELAIAVLDSSAADVSDMIDALHREHPSPADAIDAFIDVCVAALDAGDGTFGCPIAPAVLEAPDSEEILDSANRAFELWVRQLDAIFVADGWESSTAINLATLIIASVEGALILSRATRTSEPMRRVGRSIRSMIAATESIWPA